MVERKPARLVLAVMLLVAIEAQAQEEEKSPSETFSRKHQIGLRLGLWSNQGEKPPTMGSHENFSFHTNISDANFYFEGFAAYRLWRPLMVELSIGIVNRGSVTLNEGSTTDVGNLLVYPMLVHLKFYPLATLNARFQPYITAGAGVYYGHRNVQITTSSYYSGFAEESSTKFNFSFGGGVDWPLSQIIGLDLNVRYMPIKYSTPLVTVSDYSAFTVAVGVKYLYSGASKR